MPIFTSIITIAGAIAIIWAICCIFATDLTAKPASIKGLQRVLVVFPHPDDEVNVSGLIHALRRQGTDVTLITLTKGECGTDDARLEPHLKIVRERELRKAAGMLGINRVIQEDFGDGQLADKRPFITPYLAAAVLDIQPDLMISYDTSGLYGHEDHITCAEVVTGLASERQIPLWYFTLPARVMKAVPLPEHMAKDPAFRARRTTPTYKVAIGTGGVLAKIRACYAHASQLPAARRSMPLHLPVWFVYSTLLFEHYAETKTGPQDYLRQARNITYAKSA